MLHTRIREYIISNSSIAQLSSLQTSIYIHMRELGSKRSKRSKRSKEEEEEEKKKLYIRACTRERIAGIAERERRAGIGSKKKKMPPPPVAGEAIFRLAHTSERERERRASFFCRNSQRGEDESCRSGFARARRGSLR